MKICVLAYNSVLSDARILRECNSLAEAGHSINIIGFADKRHPSGQTLSNGVRVTLLDPLPFFLFVKVAVLGVATIIVAGGLFALFRFNFWAFLGLSALLVVLSVCHKPIYQLLRPHAVKLINLVFKPLRSFMGRQIKWRALRKAAAELPADVVHCHDLMTLPVGETVTRISKAFLVWDAHEIYEDMAQADRRQKELSRRLLKGAQKSVSAFITINDSIAAFYREHYPLLPPAAVIKNATVRSLSLRPDQRLHRAAKLPPEQKIVLYQGGFAEKRGLLDLVAAARFLAPGWTLIMMGWGNIEAKLRRIGDEVLAATPERKVPAVRFLPGVPQAELALWTADARIGVIPYERCGLNHLYCTPNKLWEYPNAGVPMLCSPLIEMSKVIEKYRVGWLLPDEVAPEAIAATINRLSDQEIERAKSACTGYMEQENWSVYEQRLLRLYEDLSGRASKGDMRTGVRPLPSTYDSAAPR
jgi:glycosyltransferase involved in cell wall biosynthesis